MNCAVTRRSERSSGFVSSPRYLTRFRCLGPDCEDNCCAGWQGIDVDLETYRRYQQVEHPTLGPALRLHVLPNDEASSAPDEHALIDVPTGGCCPFFTIDRLCAIQQTLGEELLPTTCDTFPRQAAQIDGRIDLAGSLSCPEVARLALLAADGLDAVEIEPDRRLLERGQYWLEAPWGELSARDPRRHYHLIRDRTLALLRRPEACLAARLRALGPPLALLVASPSSGRSRIERAFVAAADRLPLLQRRVDSSAPGTGGPPAALLRRIRPWIAMRGVPDRYRACLERLRIGLRLPSDPEAVLDQRDVAEAYRTALVPFRAYLRARPYLLEHALLNRVRLTNFPFDPRRTVYEEYALFVSYYGLLKLHLIGAAGAEGGLSDELVVATVQAFDKYADSKAYWQRMLANLKQEAALNAAGLAALALD